MRIEIYLVKSDMLSSKYLLATEERLYFTDAKHPDEIFQDIIEHKNGVPRGSLKNYEITYFDVVSSYEEFSNKYPELLI